MRVIFILTTLCWAVQPDVLRNVAMVGLSDSCEVESDKDVDCEALEATCLSTQVAEFGAEFLSYRMPDTSTLPLDVAECCLGHLRGPPAV